MITKKKTGKKGDYAPHVSAAYAHPCDIYGCTQPGVYKAPKSRDALHDYRWFCLDHIREHNEKWDYFAGLERDEIEDFIKDSVTGHRPTWDRESRISKRYNKLQDALYEFLAMGKKAPPAEPPVKAPIRKALAVVEMIYPYTEKELKAKYRLLVKKHHPDVNKGDKRSEEIFKQITSAYQTLLEHLQKPTNV
jgi:hypothetical protein